MTICRSLLAVAVVVLSACASDELSEPSYENAISTFTLGSLNSTPVVMPSAFSVSDNRVVRTDQSSSFDFAYLHLDGRHLLVPLDAIGLGSRNANPGLQLATQSFDLVVDPPSDGYLTTDSLEVHVGDVIVARSRIACTSLGVPQYAKLLITGISSGESALTFDAVANVNCGYRSLALGLPRN